ncbi:hypothetical protein ABTM44_18205, partial [Acinetobacter baumannii]
GWPCAARLSDRNRREDPQTRRDTGAGRQQHTDGRFYGQGTRRRFALAGEPADKIPEGQFLDFDMKGNADHD